MRGAPANGPAIVAARTRRGLTQSELATLTQLDAKTVRGAEQGKRLDLATLTRIAQTLDVNLSQFIAAEMAEPANHLDLRAIVNRWIYLWDVHDMEGLMALYHDECVLTIPGGPNVPFGGRFQGKQEIRKTYEVNWATVTQEPTPDEDLTIHVSGDSVTLMGDRGVHLPSGELVHFRVIQLFEFQGGLIHRHDVQYDTLDFAKKMNFPTS